MPKQGPTLASGRAAATGATAYTERARQLAEPLVPLGVASIVLMAPYNGTRSPRGQLAHYIDNVADYMLQSLAITLEGAALVRTLEQGFDGPRRDGLRYDDRLTPCVAGLSWGGAMAAVLGGASSSSSLVCTESSLSLRSKPTGDGGGGVLKPATEPGGSAPLPSPCKRDCLYSSQSLGSSE